MDEAIEDAYQDRLERELGRLRVNIAELRHDVARLSAENEKLRGLLHEARENVDQDVRELEAMYAGYPAIMDRKTAADRYLRNRIDAALAAKGE